jgi:hypothetical protein
MDFKDQIKSLGERVDKLKNQIQTEEATKNAFVMPFIQALGYDVFNPLEVVPEFIADIGTKKGEKVDYAIQKDGNPIILIECKWWGENLDLHSTQLLRYFTVTKAKFGLLTNGINYRFYTDLEQPNLMDEKPFLEFNIHEIKESLVEELKKFHKSYFDVNNIVTTASELKYSNAIRTILANELKNPSESFVKFFVGQVYQGRATSNVLAQFTEIVRKTSNQLITDMINERLLSAIDKDATTKQEIEKVEVIQESPKENKIVTTTEEIESYYLVKAILTKKIDSTRIFYRDFQNFFAILLDDNIRLPICRIYLTEKSKQIAFFDENKKEIKYEIKKLDDLYSFADNFYKAVDLLENKSTEKTN